MAVRKVKGSWWVDFMYNHERLRKRSPLNTKSGAEAFEVQLRQLIAQQGSVARALEALRPTLEKPVTFAEFAERWMRDYVAINNKPSEQSSKRHTLDNHLLPAFGSLPLAGITTLRIEQFKGQLRQAGLGAKTINNYLSVLRKCLDTAVDWQLLEVLPRIKWLKSSLPDVSYLNATEVDALVAAASGPLRDMILIAVHTGMRFCELIALEWSDLNFEANRICVRRAEVRGHVGTTKNGRVRYIPMTRLACLTFMRIDRTAPRVFHHEGHGLHYGRWLERLKKACVRANIRQVSWHALRHTFASELACRGVPLQNIKELLGHSSLTMTLRYAHLSPDTLQNAIMVLDTPSEKLSPWCHQQPISGQRLPSILALHGSNLCAA